MRRPDGKKLSDQGERIVLAIRLGISRMTRERWIEETEKAGLLAAEAGEIADSLRVLAKLEPAAYTPGSLMRLAERLDRAAGRTA